MKFVTGTFIIFSLFFLIAGPLHATDESVANFTLRDMNGKLFNLSSSLGKKVILINFWATYCIPCKQEFPHLEELHKKYKDDDFLLLAISTDKSSTISRVKPYIKKNKFTFTVLLDSDSQVVNRFNPKMALPYSVIIGKDGKVKFQNEGYKQGDEVAMEKLIQELLTVKEEKSE